MVEARPMLVGAATVFVVSDIAKSIAYYRDALGFRRDIPIRRAALLCVPVPRRRRVAHLLAANKTKQLPGHGGLCVFVKDVDAVHAELVERGAKVIKAPQDYAYGMRDFDLVDLDGNRLTTGWNPGRRTKKA